MCFYSKQSKSAKELKHRFNANFKDEHLFRPTIYYGFQFPKTPIITNKQTDEIQLFNWGLIPFWAKDDTIKKNTLNARFETINEKPSFRNIINNRCLVLADGFYEWKWLDEKGKQKQKYELTLPDNETFAFGGLWSEWLDKSTGELVYTYTILTIAANELMSRIHNTKKRMPIIVSASNEKRWLNGHELIMQNDRLIATEI
ncbi:MAG: SOS response-associated peptidase [Saprospiraceae bacterium]|nr:SOS response-associated peptidase [Saprospiraceae bacterium]MBP7679640.1 SOS response-associated peptidase [Saprospiraceae bacterium]